jgi:hypothetical protein
MFGRQVLAGLRDYSAPQSHLSCSFGNPSGHPGVRQPFPNATLPKRRKHEISRRIVATP